MANETYIGDGLYAAFDGWSFTLRAPRQHGDHFVVLEPEQWRELKQFVEAQYKAVGRDPNGRPRVPQGG